MECLGWKQVVVLKDRYKEIQPGTTVRTVISNRRFGLGVKIAKIGGMTPDRG